MGKSATVVICYKGEDHWFKCPNCESLNINSSFSGHLKDVVLEKCPDCNAEFSVPNIVFCDCGA